ncbi:MAG: hypothetical protein ABI824_05265 [Acidobacteriota bacterium]
MKNRMLGILTIGGLAIGLGWNLGAQQAAAPADTRKWKDNAEYEIFDAAQKAVDPKARIAPLDKWTQGYPQSEYGTVREDMYLVTYRQMNDCRRATDTANKIRLTRPNEFQPIAAIISCVYTFNPPTAADLTNAETVSHYVLDHQDAIFADTNRGAVAATDWPGIKPQMIALAEKTIAWVPVQQKNDTKSEAEITKYLHIDGTQATFSYYLSTAMLNQVKAKSAPPEKMVLVMWHTARAAAYEGPNAMAAPNRKQILDFVTSTYTRYHGSTQGLPELLALAKVNVFPPTGFDIVDINTINAATAAAAAAAAAAHPDLTMWREQIRGPLTGANGDMVWETTFKDAKLPGGANGVMAFKGKIISMTPTDQPKQLVLGVYDPAVADTTLTFAEALPGTMPIGEEISFNGVAKSYTKEPFMLTFEAELSDLVSWTGTNPKPATKGKGGAKGPAKGPSKAK